MSLLSVIVDCVVERQVFNVGQAPYVCKFTSQAYKSMNHLWYAISNMQRPLKLAFMSARILLILLLC